MDFNAVSSLIKDNDVVFADLRFTDTKGKEQHITYGEVLRSGKDV